MLFILTLIITFKLSTALDALMTGAAHGKFKADFGRDDHKINFKFSLN